MKISAPSSSLSPALPAAPRFDYGWVIVGLAALAMVGTLPGRTQGLGLVTEPLLQDLKLSRVVFAEINLWATLIGGLFALGVGRLLDGFGSRVVLTVVAAALGAVVLLMSAASSVIALALGITLTRGLGQSALSVVSITMVGQWFVRRLSWAMALYTVLLSIGFMAAFPIVGGVVLRDGWRPAWAGIGWALLLGLAPLALLFARRPPPSPGAERDGTPSAATGGPVTSYTLAQAIATPAFWVFGLASAVYGLTASGISLFNESILAERGFGPETFYRSLVIVALTSLVGNFLGGWLASRSSLARLTTWAMILLAVALAALPQVESEAHVAAYAVVMGLAGGFVMVIFFTVWSLTFGRAHLGKIQGAAQALTVLASAVGPLLLAKWVELTGSYATMFYLLTAVVALLGAAAWYVPMPGEPAQPRSQP